MVYFSKKRINGREYLYAISSVRLGDGRVTKLTKRVEKTIVTPELQAYFDEKQKQLMQKESLGRYKTDFVFTRPQIEKVEATRSDYRRILRRLTRAQKKDLFDRFTANFTYESNALEGNSLTLKDVNMVLFENKVVEGGDLREVYETKNSREVVDLILANKFKMGEKDIIRMHRMLVKDMGIATGYKKIPNYLLGGRVRTTPPEQVGEEMKALLNWYESEKDMYPLKKAALFHGKFERIHPFDDGNGRVGRFLLNVILVNAGYAPLIIRKSQRVAYLNALEDFDGGYTTNLERFILDKYKNTF
ncbi:MAG: Fic family protein, partial [Candidatus Altiarchaeota archaeon]|nr:Fic family protein [Candidatus Altiarchaeota archaeon]